MTRWIFVSFNILFASQETFNCSDVFYDYAFNRKDLSPVYRKNFSKLELMYEEAVNERFETPEAPELKEPVREPVRKPAEKSAATVEKKNTSKPKKEKTAKKVKKAAGKGSK